jgi:hypothetical protein
MAVLAGFGILNLEKGGFLFVMCFFFSRLHLGKSHYHLDGARYYTSLWLYGSAQVHCVVDYRGIAPRSPRWWWAEEDAEVFIIYGFKEVLSGRLKLWWKSV